MAEPKWPTCLRASSCQGVQIEPGSACLAHLDPEYRARVLSGLSTAADVDVRGVEFTSELFADLVVALGGVFGYARFDGARLPGDVRFLHLEFRGDCSFAGAVFRGPATFNCTFHGDTQFGPSPEYFQPATFFGLARFDGTHFKRAAHFGGLRIYRADEASMQVVGSQQARIARRVSPGVKFKSECSFEKVEFDGATEWKGVQFSGEARFDQAKFAEGAQFTDSVFQQDTSFDSTTFSADADFEGATFGGNVNFTGTNFRGCAHFRDVNFAAPGGTQLGPFAAHELDLSEARSTASLTIQCAGLTKITMTMLQCAGKLNLQLEELGGAIKVDASAVRSARALTLRYREVDLTLIDAAFDTPSTISSTHLTRRTRLLALVKVDATNLTLAGLRLDACRFRDCHNRDKLRIEGPLRFASTPDGLWTNRYVLAEEHWWRARYDRRPSGWYSKRCRHSHEPPVPHLKTARTSRAARDEAAQVQSIYRDLRKGREDAKDEPGATDFYFGEMEMRRMATAAWSWERTLLTAYWAISGYGLRASRALAALVLVLALGTVGFATVGFAPSTQTVYQPVTTTQPITYRQVSVPGAKPGWAAAIDHSVDSATALLRANTPRPLTGVGRVMEILLRLLGPLLLGLAVLALRNRVKR